MSRRRFLAALTPALLAAGCGRFAFRSSEVLLFCTMGYRPFEDYIWVADPTTADVRAFLRPAGQRSYEAVSARRLRGPVAVVVHETMPGGVVGGAIELFWPPRRWRRLWYRAPGSPGSLAISPTSSAVAAEFRPTPGEYSHIWLFLLGSAEPVDISEMRPPHGRTGDFSPQWDAAGERLMFRRIHVPPGGGPQTTELLTYHAATQQVSVARPPSSRFLVPCFGPDGSLIEWEDSILHRVSSLGTVTELLRADTIPGAMPMDTGLEYSAKLNAVAFTMARALGENRLQHEIWLLHLSGGPPQLLYATADSRVVEIGFAAP